MKTMNEEIQFLKADRDQREKKMKEEVRQMVAAMLLEKSTFPIRQGLSS